jgi:hypothetical protein
MRPDPQVLREILGALQMPRCELRAWLERMRAFCSRHGGEQRYARLLLLLAAAAEQLDDRN